MKNFFIYGGCVSRDTFELIKEENALVHYVARQSLISSTSKPEKRLPIASLPSDFNSRMVKGDVESSLFPKISQYANKIDFLLLDILSERLGVYRLDGGTYITNSGELSKTGILNKFDRPKTVIRFGTDRHFDIWRASALKFKEHLTVHDLLKKSYVIRANWSDRTIQGSAVPRFRSMNAVAANNLYGRYYETLANYGFNIIEPPLDISNSDENHKWGPSQYHYQNDFYDFIVETIAKA